MSLMFIRRIRRRRTPEWLALAVPLAGLAVLGALVAAIPHP